MNYININPTFRHIADEQGIEPGSPLWNSGGMLPFAGTTGDHAAYGWRHDHLLSEEWVRAVIANYGHRPSYYLNAPARLAAYDNAGRPVGWKPEEQWDLPNGRYRYQKISSGITMNIDVSGMDILHFHISPLIAVADSKGYMVKAQGKMVDASIVAKAMIQMQIAALAGMPYLSPDKMNTNTLSWADRGWACFLEAGVQAMERDLLLPGDGVRLGEYLLKMINPFYAKAFGLMINNKPALINGFHNHQTYNGLWWILPSGYDCHLSSGPGEVADKIFVWSKWMEDLEILLPGKSLEISNILLPLSVLVTDDGKPVPSLLPYIGAEHCYIAPDSTDWSLWGMRAQYVAAKVLNSEVLKKACALNLEKWKTKITPHNKAWMVDADGEYL